MMTLRKYLPVGASTKLAAIIAVAMISFNLSIAGADDGLANVKFKLQDRMPAFVPVIIYDQPADFFVATGASFTVIDKRFRDRLGPPVSSVDTKIVSKVIELGLFAAPEVLIVTGDGRVTWRGEVSMCEDLSQFASGLEHPFQGVLGLDFLSDKSLRLNFDEGFFQFDSTTPIVSAHAERLKVKKKDPPTVTARVPDEGLYSFEINTSKWGDSLIIERPLFRSLLRKRRLMLLETNQSTSLEGTTSVRTGVLESFEFGPHRFHKLVVSEGWTNTICLDFLRRFEVELDFRNKVARFRPGNKIDTADPIPRFGLVLRPRQNGDVVVRVRNEKSEVAKMGVNDGDRVLRLNGLDTARVPIDRLHETQSRFGHPLKIEFEHNTVQREIVLEAPDEVDPFPNLPPHEIIQPAKSFDN